LEEEGAIEPL
jgi:hypothetical protein